ncbi:hypothetical protein AOQ84DRAFT_323261, partial [Glonium stellatum]
MVQIGEPYQMGFERGCIELKNKAGATLWYSFVSASPQSHFPGTLMVFLNGLIVPRAGWDHVMEIIYQRAEKDGLSHPAMLSYDRFGQGDSSPDPSDEGREPGHGHDAMSAVQDLHQLILQLSMEKHLFHKLPNQFPNLLFVCNSIGCALARLFAQIYPGTVSGIVLLDSIMANSDFVSIWPDPDAPGFDPDSLPEGVFAEDLRETRAKYAKAFHPSVPNKEGLSRRNLSKLLPYSDSPKLLGASDNGPHLTVVGHDWDTFAEQSLKGSMHTPKILTMLYTNPCWQKYNEGLVHITSAELSKGPIIAKGCGHFIQTDDSAFVATQVYDMLERM